jgi:hypothetical protein
MGIRRLGGGGGGDKVDYTLIYAYTLPWKTGLKHSII